MLQIPPSVAQYERISVERKAVEDLAELSGTHNEATQKDCAV